ncbi:uncharacterized protein [Coffea arabica]|uniref:WW domain-containing protein n=1 Tax=Coffea arabica TaxID=13443 RepID=A0A6P6UKV3_COFAR|nr:uncharacterized protein LOC113712069 [Coffea arabica]
MVSLHTSLSPSRRKIIPELENLFKKRKLHDDDDDDDRPDQAPRKIPDHPIKGQPMIKPTPDTELQLETPTPMEWQRCLDIKSGQIYFYNTRTNKRMLTDPRSSPEPPVPPPPQPSHGHMSLDLELNLPCGSSGKTQVTNIFTKNNSGSTSNSLGDDHELLVNSSATKNNNNDQKGGLTRSPSWLTFEGSEQEMVAAACKKCHMLVMMCKSSPSCPNCKFMHPPEQTSPSLLKRRLSLLC